jgi:pilus assembly protein Flp/PilA
LFALNDKGISTKVAFHLPDKEQTSLLAGKLAISWRIQMKDKLWKLSIKIQSILKGEEGQDLIEYALVVALIAFAATVGMATLASDINNAFVQIGTKLTSATAA